MSAPVTLPEVCWTAAVRIESDEGTQWTVYTDVWASTLQRAIMEAENGPFPPGCTVKEVRCVIAPEKRREPLALPAPQKAAELKRPEWDLTYFTKYTDTTIMSKGDK